MIFLNRRLNPPAPTSEVLAIKAKLLVIYNMQKLLLFITISKVSLAKDWINQ